VVRKLAYEESRLFDIKNSKDFYQYLLDGFDDYME
jgi:hypothetical protein